MVAFCQKCLCSAEVVVFGQNGCIWTKVVCIRVKVVVKGQKWLYSGKSGFSRARFLYSGKSGSIRAKLLYSGKSG